MQFLCGVEAGQWWGGCVDRAHLQDGAPRVLREALSASPASSVSWGSGNAHQSTMNVRVLSPLLPAAFYIAWHIFITQSPRFCIQCSSLNQSLCLISSKSALRWGTNPVLLCLIWCQVLQWVLGTFTSVYCSIPLFPWFSTSGFYSWFFRT